MSSNWLSTLMMITSNSLGAYVPQLFTITCALSPVSYVYHNTPIVLLVPFKKPTISRDASTSTAIVLLVPLESPR